MDTVEYFSEFLKKIGTHNFLSMGIAIILIWLLFSGLRKGLKKGKPDGDEQTRNKIDEETDPDGKD
jgi:hypothetical protein